MKSLPMLTATAKPLLFWKVRVSPEKSVRNQGQEKSRHSKKRRGIWARWVYISHRLSLRAEQTACQLLVGHTLHSTVDRESTKITIEHILCFVCAHVCTPVQKKEFPSLFFCRKNELSSPFFLISHQNLFFSLTSVLKTVKKAFELWVGI